MCAVRGLTLAVGDAAVSRDDDGVEITMASFAAMLRPLPDSRASPFECYSVSSRIVDVFRKGGVSVSCAAPDRAGLRGRDAQ